MFEHRHARASSCIHNLVCARKKLSVHFVPEGVRRSAPAGDLQRASPSSGEVRTEAEERDETENKGFSLCPQTLLFQAFLIKNRRREQCEAQTLARSTRRAQHSQLFQRTEERERIKEQRGEEREGRGERYRHQRR